MRNARLGILSSILPKLANCKKQCAQTADDGGERQKGLTEVSKQRVEHFQHCVHVIQPAHQKMDHLTGPACLSGKRPNSKKPGPFGYRACDLEQRVLEVRSHQLPS